MSALLTALDDQLNLNLVIWAFPLAFLIHDLEEIVTMERFLREKRERLPKFLRNLTAITTRQFILTVGVLFALTLLASDKEELSHFFVLALHSLVRENGGHFPGCWDRQKTHDRNGTDNTHNSCGE